METYIEKIIAFLKLHPAYWSQVVKDCKLNGFEDFFFEIMRSYDEFIVTEGAHKNSKCQWNNKYSINYLDQKYKTLNAILTAILKHLKTTKRINLYKSNESTKLFLKDGLIESLAGFTAELDTYTLNELAIEEFLNNGGYPKKEKHHPPINYTDNKGAILNFGNVNDSNQSSGSSSPITETNLYATNANKAINKKTPIKVFAKVSLKAIFVLAALAAIVTFIITYWKHICQIF